MRVTEEDSLRLRRHREYRIVAEYVAAAFAEFESVQKVVLFGSVASPLQKEIPQFRKSRRGRQRVFRHCRDVDIAVWLTDLAILDSLRRARSQAVRKLFMEREIGVAHHQVDVFLISPETGAYLGHLCTFNECPKGKPECLVKDCGAMKFLRQHEAFTLDSEALSAGKALTLFERGKPAPLASPDDSEKLPF